MLQQPNEHDETTFVDQSSYAFKTANGTLFDPVMCKSLDAPLQNGLLC